MAKEAQVLAGGISYFSREPVYNADGEIAKDVNGNDIYTQQRNEAAHGDTVELSDYEFDRLAKLGAVREPSSDPLTPPLRATPFGTPVIAEDGTPFGYQGLAMGDPRPSGGEDGREADRRPLTAEETEELERRAREGVSASDFDVDGMSADEVREYIDTNKPNADATVRLAQSDPARAELVLEAELSRDNPRQGVVDRLEKIVDEEEDSE